MNLHKDDQVYREVTLKNRNTTDTDKGCKGIIFIYWALMPALAQ